MSTGTGVNTAGTTLSRLVDRIGETSSLDSVAAPLRDRVADLLGAQPLKDVLSGTWLGHPLHPLLTDLPIGFWTSAFTLDLLGGRRSRRAATHIRSAWGVVTAVPTAVSGTSDWSDTGGATPSASCRPRRRTRPRSSATERRGGNGCRGRHWRGVALGLAGATAATVGGFLGGHLLQTLGIGVDHTALRAPPEDSTAWRPLRRSVHTHGGEMAGPRRSSCCSTPGSRSHSTRTAPTGARRWPKASSTATS